jgi:hypothetical protein
MATRPWKKPQDGKVGLGAVGLLDDAIREHLELKRLRGAHPSEVSREEHEALGPVDPHDRNATPDQALLAEPTSTTAGDPSKHAQAPARDLSSVGQETAELDMRAVLASQSVDREIPSQLEFGSPSAEDFAI